MAHEPRIGQEHYNDDNGRRPHGGRTWGPGIEIVWQAGPVQTTTGHRSAIVEDLIDAAIGRLSYYQDGPHACLANSAAIDALRQARQHLDGRTNDRVERRVEGTYEQ